MIEAVTGKPFKNIALIGFKGSGKTSVGRELARITGFTFLDLDDLMQDIYRASSDEALPLREIYKKFGKDYFLRLEAGALNRVASMTAKIISFGGATPLNPAFRKTDFLSTPFVYLQAPRDELIRRITALGLPPFVDKNDPEKSLNGLMDERFPKYDEVADMKMENNRRDPAETAEEINRELEEMYGG